MKKIINIFASAAVVVAMSSCSCNCNNNCASSDQDSTAVADSAAVEEGATAVADSVSKVLAEAPEITGIIEAINGNDVTVATPDSTLTVTIDNANDELIEGSPITIKYKEEDGKLVAYHDGVVVPGFKFANLLGKWGTEGNKITVELRKRGRANSIGQQNVNFKHWELNGDTINFKVATAGNGQEFEMQWLIAENDTNKLILQNGTSTLDMSRIDAERE